MSLWRTMSRSDSSVNMRIIIPSQSPPWWTPVQRTTFVEFERRTCIGSASNHAGGGHTEPSETPSNAHQPTSWDPTHVFSPP